MTSTSPAAAGTGRSSPRAWLFLVVFLALAVALFAGTWRSPAHRNIGGFRDPPMMMWFLRWTPWAVANGHNPFVTDHIGFPAGANLMWNTTMFLPGLVLAPVTAFFGPVVAYNTLVTLNLALSGWSAFLAFRWLGTTSTAAFVGGLAYGFSPYMMAQSAEHPNLTAAYLPPIMLVLLAEILVRQRHPPWRSGAVLGALAAAQLLITEELLASAALSAGLGSVILAVLHRREVAARAGHALRALAVAGGTFAAIAAWPLAVQFLGPQRFEGPAQRPGQFVTDLANLVVPTGFQQLAPEGASSQAWTGNPLEWNGYLGALLVVVLLIAAVRMWSNPLVRVASLLSIALCTLSLGPTLHVNGRDTGVVLPWRVLSRLPLFEHMLPNRLMLHVDLLVALLVALWVDHLARTRTANRRGAVLGAAGLVAALVPLVPVVPYPSSPRQVPDFFSSTALRRIPEGTVALIAPWQQLYPADQMLWQAAADLRFKVAQGSFLGPDPQGRRMYGSPLSTLSLTMLEVQQRGLAPELTDDLRARLLADLAEREVETIVVGPMRHRAAMVELMSSLVGRPPERAGGVAVWWDVGTVVQAA